MLATSLEVTTRVSITAYPPTPPHFGDFLCHLLLPGHWFPLHCTALHCSDQFLYTAQILSTDLATIFIRWGLVGGRLYCVVQIQLYGPYNGGLYFGGYLLCCVDMDMDMYVQY